MENNRTVLNIKPLKLHITLTHFSAAMFVQNNSFCILLHIIRFEFETYFIMNFIIILSTMVILK